MANYPSGHPINFSTERGTGLPSGGIGAGHLITPLKGEDLKIPNNSKQQGEQDHLIKVETQQKEAQKQEELKTASDNEHLRDIAPMPKANDPLGIVEGLGTVLKKIWNWIKPDKAPSITPTVNDDGERWESGQQEPSGIIGILEELLYGETGKQYAKEVYLRDVEDQLNQYTRQIEAMRRAGLQPNLLYGFGSLASGAVPAQSRERDRAKQGSELLTMLLSLLGTLLTPGLQAITRVPTPGAR